MKKILVTISLLLSIICFPIMAAAAESQNISSPAAEDLSGVLISQSTSNSTINHIFIDTISQVLTSSSLDSWDTGYRCYAGIYTFTATAGQQARIEMESDVFDSFLYLKGPDGSTVGYDNNSAGDNNARIEVDLTKSGTYTVWATQDIKATGNYTLTSNFNFSGSNSTSNVSVPAVPAGLTATAASSSQVNLSWNESSGATSYKVYRSNSAGGNYAQVGTVDQSSGTSFIDTGLSASTTYWYKATAINSAGESNYSAAISVTTLSSTSQSVSIQLNVSSSITGGYVTATATATGINNPVYQFWIMNPRDNSWASGGDYSYSNSYSFTETVPGTYWVYAFAKTNGASYSSAIQSSAATVAFRGTRPAVSNLSVTGPNGNQAVGSNATFTATATDTGGTPEYQFWLHDASGWRVVQNYSTNNTYSMSNLQPGSYVVAVYALDSADISDGNWGAVYYQTFILNVNSSVSLDAPASVAVGGTVNLTAQVAGLTGVVYQFWYQTPDGIWHGSDYTNANTFSFTAGASGAYKVVVYAKDLYAPNTDQFSVSDSATIN